LAQFWLNLAKQLTHFMKKNHGLIAVVLVSVIMSSCAPLYFPSSRNAALFRGAGEVQGSVHVGTGLDAQAAVSVTNHIGLMGGYNHVSRNTADNTDDDYIKHRSWEGAIGYYENTGKICYEIFGGYGKGEGESNGDFFEVDNTFGKGTYSKFFIQPSVGTNNHIFNWIVTARVSHVDFDEISYFDSQQPSTLTIKRPDPVLFIEPSFTGRVFFGKSPIYSQFQAGFSYTTQGNPGFDYEPFHFAIGFGLRLGGPKGDDSSTSGTN
jgi:hypothetical protein